MNSQIKTDMTRAPVTISSRVNLSEVQDIMRSWGMRHLPVVDDDKLVGIVSDRDILKAFALKKPGTTEVHEVMSRQPYSVAESASVAEVAKVMADNKYGCAVVVNAFAQVTGIFTTVDALNLLSRILQTPNEVDYRSLQLKQYLHSLKRTG